MSVVVKQVFWHLRKHPTRSFDQKGFREPEQKKEKCVQEEKKYLEIKKSIYEIRDRMTGG